MSSIAISDIDSYLQHIRALPQRDITYVYRGQRDSSWPLESAAMRRILTTYGRLFRETPEILAQRFSMYHQVDLIDAARKRGFDFDSGQTLTDLRLLAKLQHFGGATGLIDFTRNPLVALWFACQDTSTDGRVFVLPSSPISTRRRSSDKTADNPFVPRPTMRNSQNRATTWEPPVTGDAAARIVAQQSIFVLDSAHGLSDYVTLEITVPADDKDTIVNALNRLGMTHHSLFVDFFGFATNNQHGSPVAYDSEESFDIGLRFHRSGEIPQAISKYTESIAARGSNGEVHFLRGNAFASLGEHESALHDYNRTIDEFPQQLQNERSLVRYNRANSKVHTSDFSGALADYNAVLAIDPTHLDARFNKATNHIMTGEYDKAIADFEKLPNDPDAIFNKAYALLRLGRLQEALESFILALDDSKEQSDVTFNIGELRRLTDIVGDSEYVTESGMKIEFQEESSDEQGMFPTALGEDHFLDVIVDLHGKILAGRNQRFRLMNSRPFRGNAGYRTEAGKSFGRRRTIRLRAFARGFE